MKKFILKISAFSILILTILTSVNYWGDSAKIFHLEYEKKIADIIFSNQNVINISNYNERILQKELTNRLPCSPDILILGSSRTMQINSTYFEGQKLINSSVSSASVEDFIAIYQMYKTNKILPKKIILGIDPWLFNNNNSTKWHSLKKEYYSFFDDKIELKKCFISNEFKQLFSLSYFQSSLRNLPRVIRGESDPIATNKTPPISDSRLVDASISYNREYREISDKQIQHNARYYISNGMNSLKSFKQISPDILIKFKQLCDEILNSQIELSFLLTPCHPLVYEEIKHNYKIALETEAKVIAFAQESDIEYLGSFDPLKTKTENNGFYDGIHCKEKTIKQIMKIQTVNKIYKSIGDW